MIRGSHQIKVSSNRAWAERNPSVSIFDRLRSFLFSSLDNIFADQICKQCFMDEAVQYNTQRAPIPSTCRKCLFYAFTLSLRMYKTIYEVM